MSPRRTILRAVARLAPLGVLPLALLITTVDRATGQQPPAAPRSTVGGGPAAQAAGGTVGPRGGQGGQAGGQPITSTTVTGGTPAGQGTGGGPAAGGGAGAPAPGLAGGGQGGSPAQGAAGAAGHTETAEDECLEKQRVFCIDTNGTALIGESDPRVGPHDSLTIVVIGEEDLVRGKLIRLEATTGSLPSMRYFRPASSGGAAGRASAGAGGSAGQTAAGGAAGGAAGHPAGGAAGTNAASVGDTKPKRVKLIDMHINDIPDVPTVTVNYRLSEGNTVTSEIVAERALNFAIGKNGYYIEPALVFPTIYGGDRTVIVSPEPNGTFSAVHVNTTKLGAMGNVSFGFNVYPFGYPGTRCPYSYSPHWDWARDVVPAVCNPRLLLRPLAIQFGTSITHEAFKQYFVGLGYTVVRGVTITGGAAFVRGEFLGPTLFEGQVVPAGFVIPSGAVQLNWMTRPYFGISLSAEILQAGLDFINKSKSIAVPPVTP